MDGDALIRSVLLAAVFLAAWISFRPFPSLAEPLDVRVAGNPINQVGYSLLFVLLAAWCIVHQPSRLTLLARPVLLATLLWVVLSAVTSWEPMLAARRSAFTLLIIGIGGITMLLPKNVRHFSDVLAAVVLLIIILCYLGVFLAPGVSIYQATDFEYDLAGDWRGLFVHKNNAGAAMVLFVFIGLFVARQRNIFLGALIIVLASIFLIFTRSATSIAMLPITLVISTLIARMRTPIAAISLTLSFVLLFNIFSVGSIYFEPIRNVLDFILSDSSFTGRTDIWKFAIDALATHPITGYGFAAFWNTPEVVYGMTDANAGSNAASHAHNGFLDLALTIGIPGAALAVVWLIVLPMLDFYRSPNDPSIAPLKMLFLRVCLFAAFASCLESMLLASGPEALFFFAAPFGLRFLSVLRAA